MDRSVDKGLKGVRKFECSMLYCRPHGGGKFCQLMVNLCTIHTGYLHRLNVDDKSTAALMYRRTQQTGNQLKLIDAFVM
jgi:hypothetical protein